MFAAKLLVDKLLLGYDYGFLVYSDISGQPQK